MKPIPVTTSSVRMWLLAHTQAHVQRDLASGRILADFVVLGQPKNYLVVGDRVADYHGPCLRSPSQERHSAGEPPIHRRRVGRRTTYGVTGTRRGFLGDLESRQLRVGSGEIAGLVGPKDATCTPPIG